jgi:hypothetical protein
MAQMFINGERIDAASGATMEVRNPATGKLVDSVRADAEDTRRAIERRGSFQPGAKRPPTSAKVLMRAAAYVRERLDEVAKLLTSEQGKPIRDSKIEAERFTDNIEIYAWSVRARLGTARPAAHPRRWAWSSDVRSASSARSFPGTPAHVDGQQDRAGHNGRQYGRRRPQHHPVGHARLAELMHAATCRQAC